jgi:flagellar transcriptional activator FlhC
VSPPKGMLPFSTDWFMTWQPNFHSSLFYNIYRFMAGHGGCLTIQSIVKSYRLYLESASEIRWAFRPDRPVPGPACPV